MTAQLIEKYSKQELEDVLSVLKDYRSSLKQIGKRAKLIEPGEQIFNIFRIEHTSWISQDFLEKFVNEVIPKYFPDAPSDVPKQYTQNEKIIGGVRIFFGDDMVDLSFQDFVQALI